MLQKPKTNMINTTMQELLESHNIPFVGTGSSECRRAFDKVNSNILINR